MSREDEEKRLARFFGRLLKKQQGRVEEQVMIDVVLPPEFWPDESETMRGPVTKEMARIGGIAAEEALAGGVIGADVGIVQTGVLRWAKEYGFEMVKGINDTSRKAIAEALEQFADVPDFIFQDFADMIAPTFGPVRSEMIAVTETTRAYYEGGAAAIDEIRRGGIKMVGIWETANDDRVCPICGPLHGVFETQPGSKQWEHPERGIMGGPPAHVRCRCDIRYEVV